MYVLVGLLVLIVALLALPLEVAFDARWPETDRNRASLSWAFGVVRFRMTDRVRKTGQVVSADGQPSSGDAGPPATSGQHGSVLSAFKVPEFRQRLWRFACDVWRAIHKRDLRLTARVGLDSPADTGLLWSILGPVSGMLRNVPDCDIALEPDFNAPSLEFAGLGKLKVYPVRIVGLVMSLLASPSLWRGVSAMRSGR